MADCRAEIGMLNNISFNLKRVDVEGRGGAAVGERGNQKREDMFAA